jgi:hypothetical protein
VETKLFNIAGADSRTSTSRSTSTSSFTSSSSLSESHSSLQHLLLLAVPGTYRVLSSGINDFTENLLIADAEVIQYFITPRNFDALVVSRSVVSRRTKYYRVMGNRIIPQLLELINCCMDHETPFFYQFMQPSPLTSSTRRLILLRILYSASLKSTSVLFTEAKSLSRVTLTFLDLIYPISIFSTRLGTKTSASHSKPCR